MKKYKTINFFEERRDSKKSSKMFKLLTLLLMIYFANYIYSTIKEIDELQTYIDNNEYKNIESIEVMSYEENYFIDINKIKEVYNTIGKNNITYMIANNSDIEVEGKCMDLNILESIKKYQYINNMSVNKIKKEGETYIFNISCTLIDK